MAIVAFSASKSSFCDLHLSVMSNVHGWSLAIMDYLLEQSIHVRAGLHLVLVVVVRSVHLLIHIEEWTGIERMSDNTTEPALVINRVYRYDRSR